MNYKKAAVMTALVVCMGAMTGCSGSNEGKTYTDYMQGLLDARYKADYSTYMRLSESTKDEAEKMYKSVIEYLQEGMYDYYEIDADCLTDELEEAYYDLAASIYKKTDYTVNDAKKENDKWHVVVDVKPIDFFDVSYEEAAEFAKNYGSDISDEEYSEFTDEEWDNWENDYAQGLLDILKTYVDKVSYGEVISMDNELTIEDDVYGFDDDDIYKIDDYVLGLTDDEDDSDADESSSAE